MSLTLQDVLTVTNPDLMSPDGVTPQNAEDFKNLMLAFMATPTFGSFPVTAWADNSVPIALLATDAQQLSKLAKSIYDAVGPIDPSTLNKTTRNPFVDIWAFSQYQELRNPARLEIISVFLTNTSGGQINLNANELIVGTLDGSWQGTPVSGTADSNGEITYSPCVVQLGGDNSQTFFIQTLADSPTRYGPPTSDVSLVVQPAVPGLTVTSLAWGPTATEIVKGSDAENDVDFYARLQAKWQAKSLLRGNSHDGWLFWIDEFGLAFRRPPLVLDADDSRNAWGGGHVVIVLDAGGADLTAITAWLIAHKSINMPRANLHVFAAQPTNFTVSGTVYAPAAVLATLPAAVNAALATLAGNTSTGDLVEFYATMAAVRGVSGISRLEDMLLNGANYDVAMPYDHYPQFADVASTLTWQPL